MALKVGVDGKFLNAVNTHYDRYNRTNSKGDEFYLYGTGKSGENPDGGAGFKHVHKTRHDRVGQYTYLDGTNSGGRAWRSYIPNAYDYATTGNTDDIGWDVSSSAGNRPNQCFLYAQGKIFVGASTTTVSSTEDGAVAVMFPHRMKSMNSTDFQQESLSAVTSNTYGKYWSIIKSSEAENYMQFGRSLAFTQGQLFVGAPGKDDNYLQEGRIYRYTGDFTYGSPTETKYDAGTIGDAGGLDFSSFGNNIAWGRYMGAANGVLCVSDNYGNAYITHLARKESDWDDWIKISGQTDPGGQTAKDGSWGHQVAVGCGRVVISHHQYDDNNGSTITNAGAFHIHDYYGNHIRTVTRPEGSVSSRFFGRAIAVGSGRIVVSGGSGTTNRDVYIFDLDGDLVKKLTTDIFNPYIYGGDPLAVGFGRIATVDASANFSQGEIAIFDLDGNLLGKDFAPNLDSNNQYMGRGGLAFGPDRLYAMGPAYVSATTHASVNEFPIYTSMTRWDVEAMEDGDV